jgi:hypothetical protein
MARRESDKPKPEIRDKDITGLKYFEKLLPLFQRLHEVGCERDTAGNRDLHFDQYCCLVLLFFFNPIVDSLRTLQQTSELKSVQKKLGVPRASLGSLSEARQVFDPELLQPIIAELAQQAQPLTCDSRLGDLKQMLRLVDGTLLTALPRMMQASLLKRQTGSGQVKWCLHTHFSVEKYVPDRIDVTPKRAANTTNVRCWNARWRAIACTRWIAAIKRWFLGNLEIRMS